MAITEHTPKMMPSIVSTERSLCRSRLFVPICIVRKGRRARRQTEWPSPHFLFERGGRRFRRRNVAPLIDDNAIDHAVLHVDDAAGARGGVRIVRDEDDGFAALVQAIHQVENFLARFGIEIAGGFVRQNHERIVDERSRHGHALLLSAGELVRAMIQTVAKPDEAGELFATLDCSSACRGPDRRAASGCSRSPKADGSNCRIEK